MAEVEITVALEKRYILVKPPAGISFWDILTAIGKLLSIKEFPDKNDLWVFQDGVVNLTLPDLQVIKDFGVANYPKGAYRKKTAIVVETNFQRALAESYIKTGEEHPREIRIFSDFDEAEEWVAED